MPEDAVEHHEVATLHVTRSNDAQAEDSRVAIKKLKERLANIGIDASRTRLPQLSDPDCEHNYRDTFEFLTIVLVADAHDQLKYEVLRRFRMGPRTVHPDEAYDFHKDVQTWANSMMQMLSMAKHAAQCGLTK